jgi:DNA end-binding protein Ku
MKAQAPTPNRSTNSIVLSWGVINIPLSVYVSTESVSVARKEFVIGTDHPVGRAIIDKTLDATIDRADIVKRAEASNGTWVELDDDEIAAVTTERGLAQIVTFIPVKDLDEYETEGLLQLRPRRIKGKTVPGADKAFALLVCAMRSEKVAALVKVALRGPARYGIIDIDGYFRWVVTSECIRQPLDMPSAADLVSPDELALGRQFIKLVGKSAPLLTDDTAATIQAYVDAKAAGAPAVENAPEPTPSGPDLINQLMASIAATRAAS